MGEGKGRSTTAFTKLKMAVLAAIPMASVRPATSVKPGRLTKTQKA
jgi:hypothetical protein